MAEEFQAGICGDTWWNWNPTRTMFAGCNSPLYYSDNSTLQMMGFGLSSSSSTTTTTSDWNQSLLRSNGRLTECYDSILQEDHDMSNFKPVNQEFPMGSSSTLLQSFFGADDEHQEQSVFNNYMSSSSSSSSATYGAAPSVSPPLTKQQQQQQPVAGSLHFSNNTSFWNASATGVNEVKTTGYLPSSFEEKPNCSTKTNIEKVRNSESVIKKGSNEAPVKRPRLETPSPLPTFKVRKEKLGDRVTALQQLVSPFGKTDTASVLHEAIEYIKFLHDQVNVLSTPYMKQTAASIQQQVSVKLKEQEDLRSRGLCLVPVSSTFPVTNETPADFWTPTFGGSFR